MLTATWSVPERWPAPALASTASSASTDRSDGTRTWNRPQSSGSVRATAVWLMSTIMSTNLLEDSGILRKCGE